MILGPGDGGSKASSFLSSLRGVSAQSNPAPAEDMVRPLLSRIEILERRLQEMAKSLEAPEEAGPPEPPTELMIYLQTRMELLERKLQAAQEEALRANLLLREREEAQRKAQKEVEDLFRSMREQSRATQWDSALRGEFAAAQKRIHELETRLQQMQLQAMPAQEILSFLNKEGGQAELEARLRQQLEKMQAAGMGEQASTPPAPPSVGQPQSQAPDSSGLAVVFGRVADLERQLEQAQKDRDEEKARRIIWEKDILTAITQSPAKWQRSGGAQLVVEAALESLVQTLKERDRLAEEMAAGVEQLKSEPPDSPEIAALGGRLAIAQDKMQKLQENLDKQMSIVQAWLQQGHD